MLSPLRCLPLLIVLALVLVAGCRQSSPPPVSSATGPCGAVGVDEPLPDLAFTSVQGQTLRLSELKGKVVLLDFWAILCAGCVEGLDGYQQDPALVGNPKLQIIAVSRDKSPAVVKKFAEEHHWTFPVVVSTPEVEKALLGTGQIALPQVRLIDPQGRLRYRLDFSEVTHETVKCLVGELMNDKR
jgi:peroxiredoxin